MLVLETARVHVQDRNAWTSTLNKYDLYFSCGVESALDRVLSAEQKAYAEEHYPNVDARIAQIVTMVIAQDESALGPGRLPPSLDGERLATRPNHASWAGSYSQPAQPMHLVRGPDRNPPKPCVVCGVLLATRPTHSVRWPNDAARTLPQ